MRSVTQPPVIPSVHVRAFATWLTIFPLVALGLTFLSPALGTAHPVLKAFILTVVIVPLAVYLVVPWLLKLYVRAVMRSRAKRAGLQDD